MFPFSRTGLALSISFHTSTPRNDDKRISFNLRWFLHHNHIVELPPGVFNNNINLTQL